MQVESCLGREGNEPMVRRAILEVIVLGIAKRTDDIVSYLKKSLYGVQLRARTDSEAQTESELRGLVSQALEWLCQEKFIAEHQVWLTPRIVCNLAGLQRWSPPPPPPAATKKKW